MTEIIVWFTLIAMFCFACVSGSYRRGQIDALTGNIKYELVVQPDSTKEWVRK